jgi:GNAT superfamily N-acetyltransferase
MDITLRPTGPGDEAFLLRVYASTREEELARVSWGAARKRQFLESQFAAQDRFLRQEYANASFQVVVCRGIPAGRLYVARSLEEIRILDLALLPEHRGRGIGSRLLESLCDEADAGGARIVIHLELGNRARHLYERFGFRTIHQVAMPGGAPPQWGMWREPTGS